LSYNKAGAAHSHELRDCLGDLKLVFHWNFLP
jgi:hypothetical protein